tara:strand:- start:115 stop:1149 length:1035 start_codon:yes stop_codon:yes gene_type:complete
MLTKQSQVAINYFLPLIKPMKGNLLVLYEHLQQYEPSIRVISDQTTKKKISLHSLFDQQFIDEHLKKDITKLPSCRTVVFQTNGSTFTLEIHYKQESLHTFINSLMTMLTFVHMLGPHKVRHIHMKYYLLDVKRVLDGDTYFDKEEVNGGSCWSGPDECSITVWRKEEILKVSIHELIHGLHYDYKQDSSEIIQHYRQKYGITSPKMNTFEAYTEIWAELLHCYLLSKLSDKHSYDLFCANVGIEREFSRLQSSKVLSLLNKNKDVNKETNVTSYYLIKTELYNDLSNFLQYCLRFNQDMIKLTHKERFLDYLKTLPNVTKKTMKVKGYLKQTTRMTCLEMKLF